MESEKYVHEQLKRVKKASYTLLKQPFDVRKAVIKDIAKALGDFRQEILMENAKDLDRMEDSNPKKDRLMLNDERLESLISSINNVTLLTDPTQKVLSLKILENGLKVKKISVPLGTVAVIYESRPNVTIDIIVLCLMSSNAIVLRGGSDAERSNKVLVKIVSTVLEKHNIGAGILWLMPTDRKYVKPLLEASKYVDIIIPRGSQNLINYVREHAKVPTIETGAGVCHTYVDAFADLDKAVEIVINAKVSRPSVCNALDTVLVHSTIAEKFYQRLSKEMAKYKVVIYADPKSFQYLSASNYPLLYEAEEDSYGVEYLSLKCSTKVVASVEEAMDHIETYSSKHSEAIITESHPHAELFLFQVDAASVYVNSSTRFTDGGCFGLGAEIGISTQKLHARGPFALEKLVTEKWIVIGSGQVR